MAGGVGWRRPGWRRGRRGAAGGRAVGRWAFQRCSSRERVLGAYEDLKNRWALDRSDEQYMFDFLAGIVR